MCLRVTYQKKIGIKFCILLVTEEMRRSRIHKAEVRIPDPDPHHNVTDAQAQHFLKVSQLRKKLHVGVIFQK
jgi:hypothetical protein